MRKGAVLALLLLALPARAAKDEDFGGGSVVFARGTSLWRTDPKGEGPEVELVTLPGNAADVAMIRSNPDGSAILFDLGGTWYWARIDAGATSPVTPEALACGAGAARFAADGACIVCAGADPAQTLLFSIATGKKVTKKVAPEGARVVATDAGRRLIFADADGIWSAAVKDLSDRTEVAPDAPVSGFLASPDGTRGVAIYPGHVYKKKEKVAADVLTTFELDGTATRRKLATTGTVIDWSWDSQWLLWQDDESACIVRAVGGETKCWKGYAAQSISPDGRWGLARGTDHPEKLYRLRLEGAHSDKPTLVQSDVEGAGLWLPGSDEP